MNDATVDINKIQSVIGYVFADKAYLISAFTHSSYVNEHTGTANERLEFLGDCVLNFLVGVELYGKDKSAKEGDLSARRSALVSREPLARLVDGLGLLAFLRVGAGVDKNAFSVKARSDLYEAIVGAIYLDGGLDACKSFLDGTFFKAVEPQFDYKSKLQLLAAERGELVSYTTEERGGAFVTTACVFGVEYTGSGRTKHASQVDAAKNAYLKLNNK